MSQNLSGGTRQTRLQPPLLPYPEQKSHLLHAHLPMLSQSKHPPAGPVWELF